VLDATAWPRIRRLFRWLEQFHDCFHHQAQTRALRRYVQGVLGDSGRKSMEAMLARVTDPGHYQALQHFITHAVWDVAPVWRSLLRLLPVRRGVLIIDDTGWLKQGKHSVGVARQYCGAVGKVANCQVAVTTMLWAGQRAWPLGMTLYVPQDWTRDPARRTRTGIPTTVHFQEKWRLALTLLRRARAAGIDLTAVVADAGFGDVSAFREALHRLQLPYALGVSSQLTVFLGTPRVAVPPATGGRGQPPTRLTLLDDVTPTALSQVATTLPARAWRRITWRNGDHTPWMADFAALRVTPAHAWRRRRLAPEVWLLCQRPCGGETVAKYFFVHLPATASLQKVVTLAHQRWAIEQQYQDLKDELGFDHFEGRSYDGWQHHAVLTAVAYTFLQRERAYRGSGAPLTFPIVRGLVRETFTALLFASKPEYLKWMIRVQRLLPLRI
jgi:SRSO17 transposase